MSKFQVSDEYRAMFGCGDKVHIFKGRHVMAGYDITVFEDGKVRIR